MSKNTIKSEKNNFFKENWKKALLGGLSIYFLTFAVATIYNFILIKVFQKPVIENGNLMLEIIRGEAPANNVAQIAAFQHSTGFSLGFTAAIAVTLLIILIVLDEKLLLKKISATKDALLLGFLWAIIFVITEKIFSIIFIATEKFEGGARGYSLGVFDNLPYFLPYWYLYVSAIIILPAIVISIKKTLKPRLG